METKATDTGVVQVLHYLKRNPKFTRDQFWAYWKDIHGPKLVPLADKYGFTQYQQVRVVVVLVTAITGKAKFSHTLSSARLAKSFLYLLQNLPRT